MPGIRAGTRSVVLALLSLPGVVVPSAGQSALTTPQSSLVLRASNHLTVLKSPGRPVRGDRRARRRYPLRVQPGRYVRRSRALASGTFVTRPDAPSYSIFWPVRYATCASSICSHSVPL